jgi:hypothetical protein
MSITLDQLKIIQLSNNIIHDIVGNFMNSTVGYK